MAVVDACDLCGKVITPEPDLWDRQGQAVWVTYAAYSQRMCICSECLNRTITLNELRQVGQRHLQGTMPTGENMPYMPYVGVDVTAGGRRPAGCTCTWIRRGRTWKLDTKNSHCPTHGVRQRETPPAPDASGVVDPKV